MRELSPKKKTKPNRQKTQQQKDNTFWEMGWKSSLTFKADKYRGSEQQCCFKYGNV